MRQVDCLLVECQRDPFGEHAQRCRYVLRPLGIDRVDPDRFAEVVALRVKPCAESVREGESSC
jgi:hypothetical protein